MASRIVVVLIVLLVIFGFGTGFVSASTHQEDILHQPIVTFGITSDIHIPTGTIQLQTFVDAMNVADPDFVIATGDDVNTPAVGEYTTFEGIYSTLTSPRYYCRGNHDNNLAMYLANTSATDAYYSFDLEGFHFVVLDSSSADIPGAQLAWLIADLAASPLKTIVFQHHPIAPFWDTWKVTREVIVTADAVRNVLEADGDVIADFCGHGHANEPPYSGEETEYFYNGIHYFHNVALITQTGYGMVNLYEDGSIYIDGENNYEDYGIPRDDWYNVAWTERRVMSTATGSLAGNVSDLPIRVELDASNFDFTEAQAAGQDIRFTNSVGDLLAHEIEWWDNVGETAVVWVKVPRIENTDYLSYNYMYWGNGVVADGQDAETVWGDYDIVDYCEAVTAWTASAGGVISLDGADKVQGASSIKNTVAAPVGGTTYTTDFQFRNNTGGTDADLSRYGLMLNFWLKCSRINTAFTTARVYIYEVITGNNSYKDLTFAAGAWTEFRFNIDEFTDGLPAPNLNQIINIKIELKAADNVAFTENIDWIEVRWGFSSNPSPDEGAGLVGNAATMITLGAANAVGYLTLAQESSTGMTTLGSGGAKGSILMGGVSGGVGGGSSSVKPLGVTGSDIDDAGVEQRNLTSNGPNSVVLSSDSLVVADMSDELLPVSVVSSAEDAFPETQVAIDAVAARDKSWWDSVSLWVVVASSVPVGLIVIVYLVRICRPWR